MVRRAIPKKAVKALIEHCNKFGVKTGRSGAEVFRDYLSWMKKHSNYFFGSPWPQKPVQRCGMWLSDEEYEFIDGCGSYAEEVERFTLVILRRNLSMQGFKATSFDAEFDFYGRVSCSGCAVPEAMRLREYTVKLEERVKWVEEGIRANPNDWFWIGMFENDKSPEYVRSSKMAYVELEFMEGEGEAEGKVCEVHNKYLCPYGAKCWDLIEVGNRVKYVWELVEFYDYHWNRSDLDAPPPDLAKWYHFGEPSILDVTSRDDILKAFEDGRMDRIVSEHREYDTRQQNK